MPEKTESLASLSFPASGFLLISSEEDSSDIIVHDKHHQHHQEGDPYQMHISFLLRRNTFAAHGFYKQEDKPSSIQSRQWQKIHNPQVG